MDIELLKIAFGVADKALEIYKEGVQENKEVVDLCNATNKAITKAEEKITDKLDRDNMEALSARVETMKLALEFEDNSVILKEALDTKVLVEIAKNRLDEGKDEWLAAYLAGKSVVIISLKHLGKDQPEMIEEMNKYIMGARNKLLDNAAKQILKEHKLIPWNGINKLLNSDINKTTAFVDGVNKLVADAKSCQSPTQIHQKNEIKSLCEGYENINDFYMIQNVSKEKIKNSIKSFSIPETEEVYSICDSSIFGSSKVGFAICKSGIYWGVDWTIQTKRTYLSWYDFAKREFNCSSTEIHLGKGDNIGLVSLQGEEVKMIVELFKKIKKSLSV